MQPRGLREVRPERRSLPSTRREGETMQPRGLQEQSKNGGVCVTHGAKVQRKRCSQEGCTYRAQNGGVCFAHGAKVKLCSLEGCTKLAKKGGVYFAHNKVGALNLNKEPSVRGGLNDGAVLGGLSGVHRAKPRAIATSRDTDKHVRLSGANGATATYTVAITEWHAEMDGANSTLRFPPFHLDFSDDEDEVGAWIWKTSSMARLVGGTATDF
jgi:hypothetical protein